MQGLCQPRPCKFRASRPPASSVPKCGRPPVQKPCQSGGGMVLAALWPGMLLAADKKRQLRFHANFKMAY